jgi:signal transduction histidine kinase
LASPSTAPPTDPSANLASGARRKAFIEARLAELVHEVLPVMLPITGVMFVFFAATADMVLPPAHAPILRWIGIVAALVFFGLRGVIAQMKLSSDAAHGAVLVATLLCITSAGTHLYLEHEPLLSNWFLLMLVGLSQLVFAPRWFFLNLGCVVVSWFVVVSAAGWTQPLILYAIAVVSFAAASTLMFFARRRSLYRLEDAKLAGDERQRELEAANRALERARQDAVAADSIKSQFLANMSHELRTPLNAIIGYAEIIEEEAQDAGDERYLEDLGRVRAAARHLLGLISDILDLTKIESDSMTLALEHLELAPFMEELVDTITPITKKNGNSVEVQVAPDVGTLVTDPLRLRQIMMNLISNAAKFTEAGTIRLVVADKHDARDALEIAVEDTGIGMTDKQLTRIFDPFRQADATTTRRYGGTGLGLAITKRLCERLGGTISVTSEPGKGSRFQLLFPRRPAS